MRLAILMTIATCWTCLQLNRCVQLLRSGSDGMLIHTMPAVSRDELEAGLAARERLIRQELDLEPAPVLASAYETY